MLGRNKNNNFHNYVLDIIDTNIYKSKQFTPTKTNYKMEKCQTQI